MILEKTKVLKTLRFTAGAKILGLYELFFPMESRMESKIVRLFRVDFKITNS